MSKSIAELERLAVTLRMETIKIIAGPGKGHVGGSMSLAEAIAVLYGGVLNVRPDDPAWADRDKLVFSKGHCGPILYAALGEFGFFPREYLSRMNRIGTRLPSHVNALLTPGVDFSTGSLGQGLSVAAGMALADKYDGRRDRRIYCIVGDGECQEGQVWEAAMFASSHQLDNLIVLVDDNKKQCSGYTAEIIRMEPLEEKFAVFGFASERIDGHDVGAIRDSLETAKKRDKPSAIVLDTVKGKDCLYAERLYDNHHIPLSEENMRESLAFLQNKLG